MDGGAQGRRDVGEMWARCGRDRLVDGGAQGAYLRRVLLEVRLHEKVRERPEGSRGGALRGGALGLGLGLGSGSGSGLGLGLGLGLGWTCAAAPGVEGAVAAGVATSAEARLAQGAVAAAAARGAVAISLAISLAISRGEVARAAGASGRRRLTWLGFGFGFGFGLTRCGGGLPAHSKRVRPPLERGHVPRATHPTWPERWGASGVAGRHWWRAPRSA